MTVQDLSQPLADGVRLAQPDGAPASQVAPGSPAASAGLPVASVDVLKKVLAGSPQRVALLVWRAGEPLFVPIAPV